jgi:hypothetical protein
MRVIRAQVSIPHDSGLPEDVVVNTFHFRTVSDEISATDLDDVDAALTALYTSPVAPSVNSLDDFISDTINGASASIKYYDMAAAEPRVPLRTDPLALSIPAGNGLPGEVAIVCSFEALPLSGIPQARHRGRIYLGPVKSSTGALDGSEFRVSSGVRDVINAQFKRMRDTMVAHANLNWIVYSAGARDNTDPDIPYDERPLQPPLHGVVMRGWTDNAYDTQRRRGPKATARTSWT